jgi:hypothetical protein
MIIAISISNSSMIMTITMLNYNHKTITYDSEGLTKISEFSIIKLC